MLIALNRENSGTNGVEQKKTAALTAFNREKKRAGLTALNLENNGNNSIEPDN